jgi:hypothetical protein
VIRLREPKVDRAVAVVERSERSFPRSNANAAVHEARSAEAVPARAALPAEGGRWSAAIPAEGRPTRIVELSNRAIA